MRFLIENNDVFSKFTYEVGKITQEFHVKLKKDAELRKQRPSKVPLHYSDRPEILQNELQGAGIIREMGSDVEMGSLSTNPIIILPKGDTVKLVIDTRYLNSITDLSNYSWPVQMLLTRLDGVNYTTSDLASAYNQVPLSEDTKKLTSFVVGGKQYMFEQGFYGLCGLPNFFSRIMTIHFAEMIAKKQAITYIDDVILKGKNQSGKVEKFRILFEMFEIIRTESCPKQNQSLFEKNSVPWTHCFRQRNSTSCQKGPRPERFEEPRKQERRNARPRKFRFLQYIHKEFASGLKTIL